MICSEIVTFFSWDFHYSKSAGRVLITHLKTLKWPWEVDEKREDPTRKHVPYRDYSLAALSFENLREKVFYIQPSKKSINL